MTLPVNRFFIEKKRSIQLIMLWLLAAFKVFSQTPEPVFEYFSVKDGLLWNAVPYVLQDKAGYLWFCSANQIQRYDGYNFVSFRSETKNPNSFYALVNTLYEDKTGNFWIGIAEGLDRPDRYTGKFIHYWHDPVNRTPYDAWGSSNYDI